MKNCKVEGRWKGGLSGRREVDGRLGGWEGGGKEGEWRVVRWEEGGWDVCTVGGRWKGLEGR